MGLTRQEIIKETGLSSGGGMSRVLKELEESGFITPYLPFQKTANESIYKLSDEYSLFYLKFIDGAKALGKGSRLSHFINSYVSWSGFAFESVCRFFKWTKKELSQSVKIFDHKASSDSTFNGTPDQANTD